VNSPVTGSSAAFAHSNLQLKRRGNRYLNQEGSDQYSQPHSWKNTLLFTNFVVTIQVLTSPTARVLGSR